MGFFEPRRQGLDLLGQCARFGLRELKKTWGMGVFGKAELAILCMCVRVVVGRRGLRATSISDARRGPGRFASEVVSASSHNLCLPSREVSAHWCSSTLAPRAVRQSSGVGRLPLAFVVLTKTDGPHFRWA